MCSKLVLYTSMNNNMNTDSIEPGILDAPPQTPAKVITEIVVQTKMSKHNEPTVEVTVEELQPEPVIITEPIIIPEPVAEPMPEPTTETRPHVKDNQQTTNI